MDKSLKGNQVKKDEKEKISEDIYSEYEQDEF